MNCHVIKSLDCNAVRFFVKIVANFVLCRLFLNYFPVILAQGSTSVVQPLSTYYRQFVTSLSKLVLPIKTSRSISSFSVAPPFAGTHFLFPNRRSTILVFRGVRAEALFSRCHTFDSCDRRGSARGTKEENDFLELENGTTSGS